MRVKRQASTAALLKYIVAFLSLPFANLVPAQTLQTLCSFTGTNGVYPLAGLTLANDGNFYGTTATGGTFDSGTVFRVSTNGTLTTLASFDSTNGSEPQCSLTIGNDDSFYGTTSEGGAWNKGTVFRANTNGTLAALVSFEGTNGMFPQSGLTLAVDGNFYGTTSYGGSGSSGTVFRIATNGLFTTLAAFGLGNNSNGQTPSGGLTLGDDGNFYGVTMQGGRFYYNHGTIFKMTPNGTITSLIYFDGTNGAYPLGGLTLGNDGSFYGTTTAGGVTNSTYTGGMGTLFRVSTNGTLSTLFSFQESTSGMSPLAALTRGNDGNFYGTTGGDGTRDWGTVFMVTTNGSLITLVRFYGTNGATPQAALTLGNDGNLYGTTKEGGITGPSFPNGMGTVFRLLLFPLVISQPQNQVANSGTTVTFIVSATALIPMSFQWQKNGTNLVDGGNVSGTTTNALRLTHVSDDDIGTYSVVVSNANGSVTNYATLTVIDPPAITSQPTNALVLGGSRVTFSAAVNGTAPFSYQWFLNGTSIPSATSPSYVIPAVSTNQVGSYSVVVTNRAGSSTSGNAALTVVFSPSSQTNYAGSTVTFTTTTFSPELLNFQWQKNGTNLVDGGNLSGATNASLSIANISDKDAADYHAVVSDGKGSVTTSNATLSVNDFLFMATQPVSQTVGVGGTATFAVKVNGASPIVLQWYFQERAVGSPTTGTNFSAYTLANVRTNQAGNYSVLAVNGYGSLRSSNALLTVIAQPTLTLQMSAGYPLLNLGGTLSNNFMVQYATNLANTNWIKLLSLTNLAVSPFLFLDPTGVGQPERFYRAFVE